LLEKHKDWARARFKRLDVQENSCDAVTQQERLEEAKTTAELNRSSLKRFEEFELERKKRNSKPMQRRQIEGPHIREIYQSDGTKIIIFPEIHVFEAPAKKEYKICAVTGLPAKYIEPYTNLPYATIEAFKTIRENYKRMLLHDSLEHVEDGENGLSTSCNL
jgi:vacuolar protein sorting-associated protein 72